MDFIPYLFENAYKASKYFNEKLPFVIKFDDHLACFRSPITAMLIKNHKKDNLSFDTIIQEICLHVPLPYRDQIKISCVKNMMIITMKERLIESMLNMMDFNNLIKKTSTPKKICVDFSSPNIAKDLHVGHLRSTIIGDVLCRLFELHGHNVDRINHLGDYGIHIGMIIHNLSLLKKTENITKYFNVKELTNIYKLSKQKYDQKQNNEDGTKNIEYDPTFKLQSHTKTIIIQQNNPFLHDDIDEYVETIDIYKNIRETSIKAIDSLYKRLNIEIKEVGESSYCDAIPDIIDNLIKDGHAIKEDGRIIIKTLDNVPLTILKSDGGYTYDTTDVAALKHRVSSYDHIYYVVDGGGAQANHFIRLFDFGKRIGWITKEHIVKHIKFGFVLGDDGTKLKSRSGDTISLKELLNESFNTCLKFINENNTRADPKTKEGLEIVNKVSIGCVKYSDLRLDRESNYKFSFDKLISINGDTASYIMYSLARSNSICTKSYEYIKIKNNDIKSIPLVIENEDLLLATRIVLFDKAMKDTMRMLKTHFLTGYLYKLCQTFNTWVTKNRCLHFNSKGDFVSANYSKIKLAYLSHKIIEYCLMILGVEIVEKM